LVDLELVAATPHQILLEYVPDDPQVVVLADWAVLAGRDLGLPEQLDRLG
jgi:hypothetical protein